MKNKKNNYRSSKLHARLSFDEGYAENPTYSIKSHTGDKIKGFEMIDLVMTNFTISLNELRNFLEQKKVELAKEMRALATTQPTINWARDERGNIASPFRTRK